MGLKNLGAIDAAAGAVKGVFADQWKEYFYCESLPADVLVVKGKKRASGRSANTRGTDNIITSGSVIAVADGQCMIIVDNGKVAELCATPGEFVYDASSEPTIFSGDLAESITKTFENIGRRFTFGGQPAKDQRVYYVNIKEITGNKYGTASPVPFRVVDKNIGLDIDIAIRCFGEYSYHIADPILFYTNVCGNVSGDYERSALDSQLKSELLTALQPALARISEAGVRYSAIPAHTRELADALNAELSAQWRDLRGIEIVSFGVSSVTASPEDERMIKELQRNAAFRDPNMAAAQMVGAQASAMQAAAQNEGAGAAMAFMGMNMAAGAGGANAAELYKMGAADRQSNTGTAGAQGAVEPSGDNWKCPACGALAHGNFCPECGTKRPENEPDEWKCPQCGELNQGNFCTECGTKRPQEPTRYKCSKCGWEAQDLQTAPKFCPNCGNPLS
jgi:membrane protease subunit (stomatin/prohibitin family)